MKNPENVIKTKEALDPNEFEEFSSIKQLSAYNYFSGEREYRLDTDTLQDAKILRIGVREKVKNDFLTGSVRNLNLTYPVLENFDSISLEKKFIDLKQKIKNETQNEVVKKLYLWKINEKIAENRMLQATQHHNDEKFVRYSIFINGKPDKKIFNYTLATLLVDVQKALNDSSNILAQEAAKRLLKEFDSSSDLESDIRLQYTKPNGKLLSLRHKEKQFHITGLDSQNIEAAEKIYTDQEIVTEFTKALQDYNLKGWQVIIDDTKTAISIGKKKIIVPKDKKLSKLKLHGLIAHEIGVHASRRENGERTSLKILSIGLDRSKDDEGIAMYEQQKITGMKDFAGFDGYLSISLALGTDGKKRDFRDVFDILTDYFVVKGNYFVKAQNMAWNRCVRTFRGTTGKTKGACFTKDLFYRENNIGVWNLIKENSAEVRRFMIGKYDPTNPRHIWILDQLNITEKDLENLET